MNGMNPLPADRNVNDIAFDGELVDLIDTAARWFTHGAFGLTPDLTARYTRRQMCAYLIGGIFAYARDTGTMPEIPVPLMAHLRDVQAAYRKGSTDGCVTEEMEGAKAARVTRF